MNKYYSNHQMKPGFKRFLANFTCVILLAAGSLFTIFFFGHYEMASIDANDVSMSLAGSGDLDAVRLKANNLSISLAGSGDIDVTMDW